MKAAPKPLLKVVAHLRDHRVLKGYTDALPATDPEGLVQQQGVEVPDKIPLRLADSGKIVSLSLKSLKALFFVKTFEGSKDYQEIKFFDAHPAIEGLWVRVRYFDNEGTEGVVRNTLDFLTKPGFFLKPPDPDSNNEVVYILKDSLREFQVLGVRATY